MSCLIKSLSRLGWGLATVAAALLVLGPFRPVLPVDRGPSWGLAGALLLLAVLLALRTSRRSTLAETPPASTQDPEVAQRLHEAAAVYDSMAEAVMITDAQALIRYVNPAFSRITGYAVDEVLGRNPRLLGSGRHETAFFGRLWQSLETRGQWNGEIHNRHKDGQVYAEWLAIRVLRDSRGGVTGYTGVFRDVGALKAARSEVERLTLHDPLTDLPNRILFNDRLAAALRRARRERTRMAVLTLDLDHFKHVNDSDGHAAGDALLRQVSERLAGCMRESDTLGRLGGDAFLVLLDQVSDTGDAALVARKLAAALAPPFLVSGRELPVSACIGISLFPEDGGEPALLIRNADTALYRAKEAGSGSIGFYAPELTERHERWTRLESDLGHALHRSQLRMEYQPRFDLADGRLTGLEALPRWHHPQLGVLLPEVFLPVAEETRLIEPVGTWMLESACRDLAALHRAGLQGLRVSVRLSPVQLRSDGFVDVLKRVLQHTSLARGGLELDLTDRVVAWEPERILRALHRLRALGVRLSIDGFGTAPASLTLLKRLPIDHLKLAPELLRGLPGDTGNAAICGCVIDLAHRLNLSVLAQGVERPAQRSFLMRAGCDEVQGPLLAEAGPLAQLLASLPALRIA